MSTLSWVAYIWTTHRTKRVFRIQLGWMQFNKRLWNSVKIESAATDLSLLNHSFAGSFSSFFPLCLLCTSATWTWWTIFVQSSAAQSFVLQQKWLNTIAAQRHCQWCAPIERYPSEILDSIQLWQTTARPNRLIWAKHIQNTKYTNRRRIER